MFGRVAEGAYEIDTYEYNGYHDSYFYSITFNPETGKFATVETGSTAYAATSQPEIPQATPEVLDAAQAALVDLLTAFMLADAKDKRLAPVKDAKVRSLTTRGKNVGLVGTVRWIGPNEYKPGHVKVGIAVDGERKLRYMEAERVEALDPAPIDYRAIRRSARVTARQARTGYGNSWRNALQSVALIGRY